MELSRRLTVVGLQLDGYRRIADIGADHGYLSVWLVQTNRADSVVAVENPAGPLAALCSTVQACGLAGRVEVRGGDGLQVLQPGELEACAIAGMGGGTIAGILSRSPGVFDLLRRVVCQPMTDAPLLRRRLYEIGWHLVAEDLVEEGGKIYEVFGAELGRMELPEPVLLEIGPLLWQNRHPLLKLHVEGLLTGAERVIRSIRQSQSAVAVERRGLFEKRQRELEEVWRCL